MIVSVVFALFERRHPHEVLAIKHRIVEDASLFHALVHDYVGVVFVCQKTFTDVAMQNRL